MSRNIFIVGNTPDLTSGVETHKFSFPEVRTNRNGSQKITPRIHYPNSTANAEKEGEDAVTECKEDTQVFKPQMINLDQ